MGPRDGILLLPPAREGHRRRPNPRTRPRDAPLRVVQLPRPHRAPENRRRREGRDRRLRHGDARRPHPRRLARPPPGARGEDRLLHRRRGLDRLLERVRDEPRNRLHARRPRRRGHLGQAQPREHRGRLHPLPGPFRPLQTQRHGGPRPVPLRGRPGGGEAGGGGRRLQHGRRHHRPPRDAPPLHEARGASDGGRGALARRPGEDRSRHRGAFRDAGGDRHQDGHAEQDDPERRRLHRRGPRHGDVPQAQRARVRLLGGAPPGAGRGREGVAGGDRGGAVADREAAAQRAPLHRRPQGPGVRHAPERDRHRADHLRQGRAHADDDQARAGAGALRAARALPRRAARNEPHPRGGDRRAHGGGYRPGARHPGAGGQDGARDQAEAERRRRGVLRAASDHRLTPPARRETVERTAAPLTSPRPRRPRPRPRSLPPLRILNEIRTFFRENPEQE